MRNAKNGQWWIDNPQRALANNSVAYTEKPDMEIFLREWLTLVESKSGERGIFNRVAVQKKASENGRRKAELVLLTNPCSEILLRSFEFCNLSEVVVKEDDTLETLLEKARVATIIGTFQSMLTNFRYLRSIWKKNTEEERLLGVSLTGLMDHPILSRVCDEAAEMLDVMKLMVYKTNEEWAEKLGIEPSVALTTVKPSGTVSELVDSSSGIHPRYSPYYIRTVRADATDPLAVMMKDQGVPWEVDVHNPTALVFSFPKKSPAHAVNRKQISAIEQLEHYKMVRDHWCDHNISITIYVKNDQWLEVGAWVYKNWDSIGGISFLPYSDHIYKQAPYTEITEEQYNKMIENSPTIDFTQLSNYENQDRTVSSQELACSGGMCEII